MSLFLYVQQHVTMFAEPCSLLIALNGEPDLLTLGINRQASQALEGLVILWMIKWRETLLLSGYSTHSVLTLQHFKGACEELGYAKPILR